LKKSLVSNYFCALLDKSKCVHARMAACVRACMHACTVAYLVCGN